MEPSAVVTNSRFIVTKITFVSHDSFKIPLISQTRRGRAQIDCHAVGANPTAVKDGEMGLF